MPNRSPAPRDYRQDNDANLVTLARAGDGEAFTEIVRRRHAKIRQSMRYLSGHANDGDDLAQQVLLRAWKAIRRLETTGAFDSWLRRIMVTTWLDQAKKRQLDLADETDPDERPAPAQSPNTGMDLVNALAILPPGPRLCVVLAYHYGYTHDQIAELTGLPVGTVKSHILRGAARLRSHLASYEGSTA